MSVQPFMVLDAATATGFGPSTDLEDVYYNFTVTSVVTGSPTSGPSGFLQGSLDDNTWYTINMSQSNIFNANPVNSQGLVMARFVRVDLQIMSGGSSPTATVWLAAAR